MADDADNTGNRESNQSTNPKKQLPPNNHILEAIRYRLSTFNLSHAISEKLLDLLLVYGEGFHRRLFDILKQCDEQQTPKRSPIVHRLLTKRERDNEGTDSTGSDDEPEHIFSDITCKLALSIWTLFLQIIQHCLLNHSASGHISPKCKAPESEIQVLIHDFLTMSKSAEMASEQSITALNAEIANCKKTLSQIMASYTDLKADHSSYKEQITNLQHTVHQQTITCSTLKDKISKIQCEKTEREKEALYLQKDADLIRIRTEQLYKKRMELKEQNDRLQSATDHLRNKIAFYTEECDGYRVQHERLSVIVGEHEDKMKGKQQELDRMKADYWILQKDNMELQRQCIATESTLSQFESQRDALVDKRDADKSTLYDLESVIAAEEEKQNEAAKRLKQLKASIASMAKRQEATIEKLHKMRLELEAKCTILELAQQELEDQRTAIDATEREIEALKLKETALREECELKRSDVIHEEEERDRFSCIYKEKLAELNNVETAMIGHSKKVNAIEAEIDGLQHHITEMKAVCDELKSRYQEQEVFIAQETKKRKHEIECRREKVVRIMDDLKEHRKALDAVNEELFDHEKRYTDALTVFHIERRHLKALRSSKMRYGVQYNQLMEDHKKLERAIRAHDREIKELDHKMQQQLIDTNEWKSKIYAISGTFDQLIKERCAKIEELRSRQSILGERIIAKDRELVSIRRVRQMEIAAKQKKNQSKVVEMESELEALSATKFECAAPVEDGGGVLYFENDKKATEEKKEGLDKMKREIESKTMQHIQHEAEIELLKDQHKDLGNDWETTRLCKEHLAKELGELNEYEAQLLRKLCSLESEWSELAMFETDKMNRGVGTSNENEGDQ